jgi:hypothetical protein
MSEMLQSARLIGPVSIASHLFGWDWCHRGRDTDCIECLFISLVWWREFNHPCKLINTINSSNPELNSSYLDLSSFIMSFIPIKSVLKDDCCLSFVGDGKHNLTSFPQSFWWDGYYQIDFQEFMSDYDHRLTVSIHVMDVARSTILKDSHKFKTQKRRTRTIRHRSVFILELNHWFPEVTSKMNTVFSQYTWSSISCDEVFHQRGRDVMIWDRMMRLNHQFWRFDRKDFASLSLCISGHHIMKTNSFIWFGWNYSIDQKARQFKMIWVWSHLVIAFHKQLLTLYTIRIHQKGSSVGTGAWLPHGAERVSMDHEDDRSMIGQILDPFQCTFANSLSIHSSTCLPWLSCKSQKLIAGVTGVSIICRSKAYESSANNHQNTCNSCISQTHMRLHCGSPVIASFRGCKFFAAFSTKSRFLASTARWQSGFQQWQWRQIGFPAHEGLRPTTMSASFVS